MFFTESLRAIPLKCHLFPQSGYRLLSGGGGHLRQGKGREQGKAMLAWLHEGLPVVHTRPLRGHTRRGQSQVHFLQTLSLKGTGLMVLTVGLFITEAKLCAVAFQLYFNE